MIQNDKDKEQSEIDRFVRKKKKKNRPIYSLRPIIIYGPALNLKLFY